MGIVGQSLLPYPSMTERSINVQRCERATTNRFEQVETSSVQGNGSSLDCLSMIVQSINGPAQAPMESHYSSHH
ncbi:hypothetical protein M0804_013931 [Polistes exclamans]|nr:hypothetical protein M0804_013937 [Polistes exclamans]KAI4476012.1 hypothetical protein M0804_013931 [Polistes exclamans]